VRSSHYKKLSEIIDSLESGSRPKGGVSIDSGDIPSLGAEHLNDEGGFNFSKIKKIETFFYEKMRNGKIKYGDILIVKDGATTGKTSFVEHDFPFKKAAVNEHVFILRAHNNISDSKYIFHFLKSSKGKEEILLDFRGATVGGISRGFLDKVNVPLPPLEEQKRIASILDKAELVKRKRELAIEKLDELAQSIFEEMFGGLKANQGEVISLGECLKFINGRAYSQHELLDSGTPIIRIQNLNGGERWYYSNLDLPEDKYCDKDDLLFAWSATFGPYIWQGQRSIYHYHIWKVEPFDNMNKLFAFYLLKNITKKIKQASHGASMLHMTKSGMEAWKITLPNISQQIIFSNVIHKLDELKFKNMDSIKIIIKSISSIQSQAFSGQL
jgi:type I restriction enzyme S subunit